MDDWLAGTALRVLRGVRSWQRHSRRALAAAGLIAGLMMGAVPVQAGPPYITDDPEPTDFRHWEIYNYGLGTVENGATAAEAGVEVNYGGAKNLQLAMTLPLDIDSGQPASLGDIQLAAKYKFLHQDGGFPLGVAFYPRIYVPTGRGSNRVPIELPLWVEHDWKGWSVFGGGGYTANPGAGNRSYWQQGVVVTHEVRPGMILGLEYYGQGPATVNDRTVHGLNLGTQIHLNGPFSLVSSFGQGLNRKQTVFYAAVKLDL